MAYKWTETDTYYGETDTDYDTENGTYTIGKKGTGTINFSGTTGTFTFDKNTLNLIMEGQTIMFTKR